MNTTGHGVGIDAETTILVNPDTGTKDIALHNLDALVVNDRIESGFKMQMDTFHRKGFLLGNINSLDKTVHPGILATELQNIIFNLLYGRIRIDNTFQIIRYVFKNLKSILIKSFAIR